MSERSPRAFSPPALSQWLEQTSNADGDQHANEHVDSTKRPAHDEPSACSSASGRARRSTSGSTATTASSASSIASPERWHAIRRHDYGTAVTVSPPAADQISTKSELQADRRPEPFTTVTVGHDQRRHLGAAARGRDPAARRAGAGRRRRRSASSREAGERAAASGRSIQDAAADDASPVPRVRQRRRHLRRARSANFPTGVKKLTLGFVGGKTHRSRSPNPLVWVGPSSPLPAYLGVDARRTAPRSTAAPARSPRPPTSRTRASPTPAATAAWALPAARERNRRQRRPTREWARPFGAGPSSLIAFGACRVDADYSPRAKPMPVARAAEQRRRRSAATTDSASARSPRCSGAVGTAEGVGQGRARSRCCSQLGPPVLATGSYQMLPQTVAPTAAPLSTMPPMSMTSGPAAG